MTLAWHDRRGTSARDYWSDQRFMNVHGMGVGAREAERMLPGGRGGT